MRFMVLGAVFALFAMFIYGCASTNYAVGSGGVGAGIEKLEESHGFDHALSYTDRFDRMQESPEYFDVHYRWFGRRVPR